MTIVRAWIGVGGVMGMRLVAGLAAVMMLAGCSVTAPVAGIVGKSGDYLTGTATGYMDRTGTITMASAMTDRKCIGQFRYTGTAGGKANFNCSDGSTADVQFIAITNMSGHGYGITNRGEPISFTYGLTPEESQPYLGASTSKIPASPGSDTAKSELRT